MTEGSMFVVLEQLKQRFTNFSLHWSRGRWGFTCWNVDEDVLRAGSTVGPFYDEDVFVAVEATVAAAKLEDAPCSMKDESCGKASGS